MNAKLYHLILSSYQTHRLPGRLYLKPLKDFWVEEREDHHLLQRRDVSAQTSNAFKPHLDAE